MTRVAVVRFPGSLDHESAARAVRGPRRRRRGGLARRRRAARGHRRRAASPGASPTATTCAAAPSPAARRSWPRCAGTPRRAAGSSASATASRCCARRACCRGRCAATRTLSFVCRQMELEVADDGTPWTAGRAGRRDALDPDQEQRGRLVRRPVRGAGGAALPRQPAGLDRPGRRHRERRGQRDGPDAPPRGGVRPAARLDRRAAWCCAGLVRDEHRPTLPRHRQLGLTDDEAARIPELLGREPTDPELVMFSLMWSEHCSYKHSRPLLRGFPTTGDRVLQGPGENAGVVDVGDGMAVALKIESHNHPSAVEPFEGAATGVGGIVRDILAMGARPIALLDCLRFGELTSPAQPPPVHALGGRHRPLRQLHRGAHRRRRGLVRRPLRGVVPGQRHVRRRPRATTGCCGRRPRARATRSCCSATAPAATASAGRACWPRPSWTRTRTSARRCR